MKRITIGGVEYTIEFSIEATLYNEVTESVMDMFLSGNIIQAVAENADDVVEKTEKAMKQTFKEMADIPNKALTMFYAGLLEHHGSEGDNTVRSKQDAKRLLVTYLKENKSEKEEESLTLYDVMTEMLTEMGNDSFFDMIGLAKVMNNAEKEAKKPQDHKRKATKVGKN